MERIDELNAKLEQAREQNRKLEAEAEHLAAEYGKGDKLGRTRKRPPSVKL